MINNEKTEITIKGKTHKISDIEIITVSDNFLMVYSNNDILRYPSTSPISELKQIGIEMYLKQINTFALWIGGNNIFNTSKITSVSYEDNLIDVKVQTKNHAVTFDNFTGVEVMCLKQMSKRNNEELTK